MHMKAYEITGTFADARQGRQPFSIEAAGESEDAVKEQVISSLGSRHKVKRWQVDITEVVEIAAEDITDHTVRYKVTGE